MLHIASRAHKFSLQFSFCRHFLGEAPPASSLHHQKALRPGWAHKFSLGCMEVLVQRATLGFLKMCEPVTKALSRRGRTRCTAPPPPATAACPDWRPGPAGQSRGRPLRNRLRERLLCLHWTLTAVDEHRAFM